MKAFTIWTRPILQRSVTEYVYVSHTPQLVDGMIFLDHVIFVACWACEFSSLTYNNKPYRINEKAKDNKAKPS